ncbi:monoacylglycerol/Diacylglycerol O-acyltransferase [Anolis carolinensis]|uniref:Phospholipid/glycerol acyltransferase domain-containing protein n=1 Tax=Anolis carolinensis TaxID=28377 RepID=R4GAF4_ANOCA|nr:PREDICTED: transmembrane protein 68 [Anolis carolinensis]|eukprot:XP_003224348.1 PREDICTED: transmembrane protein 68 [Anolis carolinensis]
MMSPTTLDASRWESLGWYTATLKVWIRFIFLHEYTSFVAWWLICVPILVGVAFALIVYIVISAISLFMFIYKKINNAPEDMLSKVWDKPRHILSYLGATCGKILHGYEIIGVENIPEGPGIIVLYHGAMSYDYSFFASNMFLLTGRVCHSVVDNKLFTVPGLKGYLELFGCIPGSRAKGVEILKKGQLLGVVPGGMKEALFGDNYYQLMWGNRTGFAHVALEAKVPIIPMFTQNIREVGRTFGNTRFTRWLHDKTRWFFLPIIGYFPVKLRTYLGEPIPYDPNITAEELVQKTKTAIENIRDKHQKIPGSILRALSERFEKHHKEN